MEIQKLDAPAFVPYGRVISDFDCAALQNAMEQLTAPSNVIYEPGIPALENLSVAQEISERLFGGLPTQVGYCNGENHQLDAVEYHRSSEINYAATDLILLLGRQQDIDPATHQYDTAKMEAFLVPAGTMLEVYATTLHYAPCSVNGKFRCMVALPKGTNEPLKFTPKKSGEDALLFAQNKWLLAHPESGLDKDGAFLGLTGENLRV
ncbi:MULTISPECIES: DUF4867 family protein [Caproicibacterium]|uniref:DUF4867 family protein n=1 Tax=Caproicibacterium argilliputei TaxID=3030016 RepID=A0AA97DBX2_9FIRM|nr:DUF4867 family protein [Caproicibacterium argilliputei]WOC32947.1 DUF4867 family protein [Caproicibacterium argilliputei]